MAVPLVPWNSVRSVYPGQKAVDAWITPVAPLAYRTTAFTTSSDSILCSAPNCQYPNNSLKGPASQRRTSSWWMAWLISAPPPSVSQLPLMGLE
jgi:hypothetical protein